VQDRRQES